MLKLNWLDPNQLDPEPELQKFVAGSGSGINHSVSAKLPLRVILNYVWMSGKCHKDYCGTLCRNVLHITVFQSPHKKLSQTPGFEETQSFKNTVLS